MGTVVSTQSWGSRIMDSLKNIVFGIVIFILGIGLLWWNEHRAVKDYKELNDVRNHVVSVSSDSISPANDGNVIHVTGKAETEDVLKDPFFEVEANAIRFRRKVEMYQWKEHADADTKKKVGGSAETTTVYTYEKVWSESLIDSSSFDEADTYPNPGSMLPEGWSDFAKTVTLDSFTLSQEAVGRLTSYESYTVHSAKVPEGAKLENSMIYYGNSSSAPEIGDKRVSFQIVPQKQISVIAAQSGSELKPWRSSQGREYLRIQTGSHSADEMLEKAESEVRMLTWILRVIGWALLSFGMITVLTPLAILGDVLPFLGTLIGGGIKFFSFLTGLVIALTVIGFAWMAARPLIGIPLVLGAVALVAALTLRAKKQRAKAKTSESVPA